MVSRRENKSRNDPHVVVVVVVLVHLVVVRPIDDNAVLAGRVNHARDSRLIGVSRHGSIWSEGKRERETKTSARNWKINDVRAWADCRQRDPGKKIREIEECQLQVEIFTRIIADSRKIKFPINGSI